MYQQVDALETLERRNLSHGEVQPMYMAYDPKTQDTQLIDNSQDKMNQKQLLAAQSQKLIQNKGKVYQSPTVFNNLKKKNLNFTYD